MAYRSPRFLANAIVSDKMVRERIYSIVGQRDDKKDILAQVAITVDQLVGECFTGMVTINFCDGGISDIRAVESEKIPIYKSQT